MSVDGDVVADPVMDVQEALKVVLKKALIHDGLARGLRECVKALDRKEAHLCVLASYCNEADYRKLVINLCKMHNIKMVPADLVTRLQLGEWVGLCKRDQDDRAHKIVPTSCVVVKNYGETSGELDFLLNYLKTI